jgi:hypothetical protein
MDSRPNEQQRSFLLEEYHSLRDEIVQRVQARTSTPTDETLETDQLLQSDLLEMLDEARASDLAHGRLKENPT